MNRSRNSKFIDILKNNNMDFMSIWGVITYSNGLYDIPICMRKNIIIKQKIDNTVVLPIIKLNRL